MLAVYMAQVEEVVAGMVQVEEVVVYVVREEEAFDFCSSFFFLFVAIGKNKC